MSACSVGDLGLIPGLGRCPGKGNGNPLQYSSWKIPWTEEPGGDRKFDQNLIQRRRMIYFILIRIYFNVQLKINYRVIF